MARLRTGHRHSVLVLLLVAVVWSVALGDDSLGTQERVMFWGDHQTQRSSSASGVVVSAFKGVIISLDTFLEAHKVSFMPSIFPLLPSFYCLCLFLSSLSDLFSFYSFLLFLTLFLLLIYIEGTIVLPFASRDPIY